MGVGLEEFCIASYVFFVPSFMITVMGLVNKFYCVIGFSSISLKPTLIIHK